MDLRTPDDLQALIASETPESTSMEYKSAPAINDKGEIGKDVSSMANASGGTIIYGMVEIDHKPSHIDPISNKSREYLDQVITSQVRPKVKCQIYPIDVPGGVVYVVEIEQGETAHQAKVDCRYHRRRNFTTDWMEDYEIRDVMNRSKNPRVILKFSIEGADLIPYFFNDSATLAKDVRVIYEIPSTFLNLDVVTGKQIEKRVGPHGYKYFRHDVINSRVIHGGQKLQLPSHKINKAIVGRLEDHPFFNDFKPTPDSPTIDWRVCADNADPIEGRAFFADCINNEILK